MSSKHNRNFQPQQRPAVTEPVAAVVAPVENHEHMRESVAIGLPADEPVEPRVLAQGTAQDLRAAAESLEHYAGLRPFTVKGPGSVMIEGALKIPGTRMNIDYAMFKLLRAELTQG